MNNEFIVILEKNYLKNFNLSLFKSASLVPIVSRFFTIIVIEQPHDAPRGSLCGNRAGAEERGAIVLCCFYTGLHPVLLDNAPNFVPYGTKLDLKYLCSLTYCSIMYILVISRRRCLEGGRSPTGKHLLREPP